MVVSSPSKIRGCPPPFGGGGGGDVGDVDNHCFWGPALENYWSLRSKSCKIFKKILHDLCDFLSDYFWILSEATLFMRRPTAHMKIKKRCAWKKEHETLTLGKRLRGQPGKKGGKIGLRLEIGDLYFGGPALDIVWSLRSKSCKIFKKILNDLCDF